MPTSTLIETQPTISLHDPGFGSVTVWHAGACLVLHGGPNADIHDLARFALRKLQTKLTADQSGDH